MIYAADAEKLYMATERTALQLQTSGFHSAAAIRRPILPAHSESHTH